MKQEALEDTALMAQAGAWLARLHGPNRTQEVEDGFRAWMNESADHVAAFEHMTDTWEKSAQLRRRPVEHLASWERPGFRLTASRAALATAAVAALAIISTAFYLQNDAVTTAVGEQRILTLDDGSRVHLNTATQVIVRYDSATRLVELEQGEAFFEVAKASGRPFIVTVAGQEIRALGTSFVVRREAENLMVTLVDGRVAVAPNSTRAVMLSPGERVTFPIAGSPRVDRPELNKMMAWQRGQVAFDGATLQEAVAEMNRYSLKPIVIDAHRIDAIRISGIFRAGDSSNFSLALARNYDLGVTEQRDRILIDDAANSE